MADLFWLSDEQWAVLEPFKPQNQPGARRVDDRRVVSGIVHVSAPTHGCTFHPNSSVTFEVEDSWPDISVI